MTRGKLATLEAAMATGVTFGTLPIGARFHFPSFPTTVYIKTSARLFRHSPEKSRVRASFTTGAKTAVVDVTEAACADYFGGGTA